MNKKRLVTIVVLSVLLIAVLALATIKIIGYMPYFLDKNGINQKDTEYTLTIDKTDFENEVALKLEKEGIIVSAVRFLGYLKQNYPDFVWLNGEYVVRADMSYKQLCKKLQNPDRRIEYKKFTVPEGKNIRGIAQIVEQAGICSADDFLKAADSYDYDFDFIAELKQRDADKIGYKLEGYLFPATYEFRADTVTAEQVVEKMLSTFDAYVTKEIREKAKQMGLTLNELVTFGSVIQAEAFSKESMANISSVFWNRLGSKSMRQLQSDPTMTYADGLKQLGHYSESMAASYDTYKCIGLPVGPTNCPGMDVINAVINPAKTDYYYFVTDSNGDFYYNETYIKHNATIRMLKNKGLWG